MKQSLKDLLYAYEQRCPEIVFEWTDSESNAKGWLVINSLRGGASGGGTRLKKGITKDEVLSLAKTMEVKFTVSGPQIGGAKSGIDFDPAHPDKKNVLSRWFKAVMPFLKNYYGTGGDLNVSEGKEVVPLTEEMGVWHPQEGIVVGHFSPSKAERIAKIGQLRLGVPMIIGNDSLSPSVKDKFTVSDMITGYGLAESVIHYYQIWRKQSCKGKRVLIQGWGNVGAAAGYYLSVAGCKVVGVMDKEGAALVEEGFTLPQIRSAVQQGLSCLPGYKELALADRESFWKKEAEVFLPCAGSRLVDEEHLNALIENVCELIAAGANVPFNDDEIFYGKLLEKADRLVSVIPDFIANCGMARTFYYCMSDANEISSSAIFKDVSVTIHNALKAVYDRTKSFNNITKFALEEAVKKLL